MEKYFKELIDRFVKISDTPISFNENELVISRNDAIKIIFDVQEKYEKDLWIPVNEHPENKYGESSRPILVRYKDETAVPEVCTFNFIRNKFIFIEKDVTDFVKEWCEIPGYGYEE